MSADDTKLDELVRWREGLVSGEIFVDPGIHRQETERVFPRAWSYLVHESQLRQAGDFVTTFIGADPVLVARQRDGSIAAMLNSCRHRGMAVCRADAGNARAFTCPFHGWTFNPRGRCVDIPYANGIPERAVNALKGWPVLDVTVSPRAARYTSAAVSEVPSKPASGDRLLWMCMSPNSTVSG